MFAKFEKRELNRREIGEIELKQRQLKKNDLSVCNLILLIVATLLIATLVTSCTSSGGGGGGGGGGQNTTLRGEPITPPLTYDSPVDTDGNGFLELWHPTHLLALTNSCNNNSLPLNGSYELTMDISLTEYPDWCPIGNLTHPFTGNFDGRNYSISGISSTDYDYAGLFGVADGASISNLNIRQVNVWGNQYAGALAGLVESTNISNVEVNLDSGEVRVFVIDDDYRKHAVGGIVGYSESSNLDDLKIIGTGLIRISGQINSMDNVYYSGGLVGLAEDSIYSNLVLDAQLDIVAGNRYIVVDNMVGGLIGRMRSSSMTDADVNFRGRLLAQGANSDNTVGGLIGNIRNSNIHGVTAVINSSIMASPVRYYDYYSGFAISGGVVADAPGSNQISDITMHIIGDLIANNTNDPNDPNDSYVGSLLASGSLESADNINILIDGDLIAIGDYNEIAGVGSMINNLTNSNILINGNLLTKFAALTEEDSGSRIGGILVTSDDSQVTNVSVVINGNVFSESLSYDNDFGMMFADHYSNDVFSARDSSVVINGFVNVLGVGRSEIKFGGFIGRVEGDRLSIDNSYTHITGGVTINATSLRGLSSTLDIGYVFGSSTGDLLAEITHSYFAMDNPLAIYVDDVLAPEHFGGAFGLSSTIGNLSIQNSYYHTDVMTDQFTSMPALLNSTEEYRDYFQLRCPTSPGENCGGVNGSLSTYVNWDLTKWDFNSATELPRLRR